MIIKSFVPAGRKPGDPKSPVPGQVNPSDPSAGLLEESVIAVIAPRA